MSSLTETTGARYWRSLDELTATPEFREMVRREFPDDQWDRLPPATRRQFLRVMGASLGLAGLTACRWPEEEIVPFSHRPEDRVPGVPQHFATAVELGGAALGVVATAYDGRPIKLEGNTEHPDSRGALSAVAQAAVLDLYDPDRSRRITYREGGQEYVKSSDDVVAALRERVRPAAGGVAVLAESSSSPTLARLRGRFLATHPKAGWYEYEPVSRDNERAGLAIAFGGALRANPRLDRARVVACFDADPLFEHPAAVRLAGELADARHPSRQMASRLYSVESVFSLTGARADHRLAVAASQVSAVLAAVTLRLVTDHGLTLPEELVAGLGAATAADEFVARLAADLAAERGRAALLVGPRQAPAVHALAAIVNRALGNAGEVVAYTEEADGDRPAHVEAISELAERIGRGEIETLIIVGGNPAYDAPADLGFAELLGRVPSSLHLSLYDDETSRRCSWHVPRAHSLESWGDGRAWDGTVTLQQPLVAPLYGGWSAIELVGLLIEGRSVTGHSLVRETAALAGARDERGWRRWLHDGVAPQTAWREVTPRVVDGAAAAVAAAIMERLAVGAPGADRLELVLTADARVHDGRFANNGWLQELPDAVSKITWDNALLMSPATARALGLVDGEVVEVGGAGTRIELPVYLVPGMARYSCTTSLGYGRTAAGRVGNGVGVDAYPLRTRAAMDVLQGVSVRATGRRHRLATTQDHHAIDRLGFEARNLRIAELVRETTIDALRADPEVVQHMGHHPPLIQLWKAHEYEGEQWGMAIDLNACTGCNACVVACQAENNIPLVGREQVINQREMHWLRIDRYFRTDPATPADEVEDAAMVFQPVACVQCENAPCEQVCPVGATQHTSDGLNAMAYNRCIGTRYCSNNCPYKVRRFNFFNYRKQMGEIAAMQLNPEVTVRSRGVMEKCTYCVQRIQNVRIVARNEQRPIADGEVVPACAQTCPTRAIHFGNLNDPESRVAALRDDARAYATLAELNVRPRTHYLARLNNPVSGAGEQAHHDHDKEST